MHKTPVELCTHVGQISGASVELHGAHYALLALTAGSEVADDLGPFTPAALRITAGRNADGPVTIERADLDGC